MDEIGLFPLGLVLLPEELLPLHIFEPRYRELIGECVEQASEFGILLEDASGLRQIGTTAAVVEVIERLPDGRLNVVVEGRRRFQLVRETAGRSYRTGEVRWRPPTDLMATPEATERLLAAFDRLAAAAGGAPGEIDGAAPSLAWRLGARMGMSVDAKQSLLELDAEGERVERLVGILGELERGLARRQETRERAATNGKVDPAAPAGPSGQA